VTISEHLTQFAGLPVEEFDPEKGLAAPETVAYCLRLGYDAEQDGVTFSSLLSALTADPRADRLRALVIGCWDSAWEGNDSSAVVEALVSARDRLTGLQALFFGDITYEETEMSWINQSDISPLFEGYPLLEEFVVRGGSGLSLGRPSHERLKKLTIQTGGMSQAIVREVISAQLPALEHLELWLGDSGYGYDATLDDLAPILSGEAFPNLRYLGLRNAENADEIAQAVAQAPILSRLKVLDLSLGTLGDEGAETLLNSPAVKQLEKLDLHHHYVSDAMIERLKGMGIEIDHSQQMEADDWGEGDLHRYVAVSE
jgi:hypothetical protein